MTDDEIRGLIKEAIQFAEPELGDVNLTAGSTLSELGISSVSVLEIIGYIEDRLGIRLPDDELAGLNSLPALEKLIHSHLSVAQTKG
jgi:acyl carrier protein